MHADYVSVVGAVIGATLFVHFGRSSAQRLLRWLRGS